MNKKLPVFLLLILSLALAVLPACNSNDSNGETTPVLSTIRPLQNGEKVTAPTTSYQNSKADYDSYDALINLNGNDTTLNGKGVSFENSVLTVTSSGAYLIKGTLPVGRISVENKDGGEVKLFLNGVKINCDFGTPLYIEKGSEAVSLVLSNNTTNTLSEGKSLFASSKSGTDSNEENPVIFSKSSLQIYGDGELNLVAASGHGVFSTEDIDIRDIKLNLASKRDGVSAEKSIRVSNCVARISCGGDAIRTYEAKSVRGDITLDGGKIDIESEHDAIDSVGNISVKSCDIKAVTGSGIGSKRTTALNEEHHSCAGLKADGGITLTDGFYNLNTVNDAFFALKSISISGGSYTVSTDGDAVRGIEGVYFRDCNFSVKNCKKGIEASKIRIASGNIEIESGSTGVNATGTVPFAVLEKYESLYGEYEVEDDDCSVKQRGGSVRLICGGVGIKSDGDIEKSGGSLVVFVSKDNKMPAYEAEDDFEIDGGVTLLAHSARDNFNGVESDMKRLVSMGDFVRGSELTIKTINGRPTFNEMIFADCSKICLISPKIRKGIAYTVSQKPDGDKAQVVSRQFAD